MVFMELTLKLGFSISFEENKIINIQNIFITYRNVKELFIF